MLLTTLNQREDVILMWFYHIIFRSIWFEAATVVAVPPPVELPASSVLKAALVGGLSCALSCSLLHPVDTVKVNSLGLTVSPFPFLLPWNRINLVCENSSQFT